MAGICPADCSNTDLLPNDEQCDLNPRLRGIERLGIFTCDTELPSPLTCVGLEALVTDNKLVFTNPLAQVDVQDPNYAEIVLSDCLPAFEVVTNQIIAARDVIKVDIPADGTVSPATAPNPNYNWKFWADKRDKQLSIRYMIIYCNGDVVIPRDTDGNYLSASLRVSPKYENVGSAQAPIMLEYLQLQFNFRGNPLDVSYPPEENADGTVFNIDDCDIF